jgi:hypothetical protein
MNEHRCELCDRVTKRGTTLNTIEKPRNHPEIANFIVWVRKQK